MKKLLGLVVFVLSAALLIGCGTSAQKDMATQTQLNTLSRKEMHAHSDGGVLLLKVNPEIAVYYDENGKVTKLEGRNADGVKLLEDFTGYAGKDTSLVLETLVERIGEAGYFVEEADGTARKIVLELDPGSQVPNEQFLQDMADHVKSCVESQNWVGEKEYEYPQQPAPAEPKPAPTEPKPSKPAVTLCEICGDDDCNDGKYCNDADDLAENLKEAENRKNGTPCEVCDEYDCDDGKYCDDWDEKRENLREEQKPTPTEPKPVPTEPKVVPTEPKPSKPAVTLCEICGDDDCDDGKYCDDGDELKENLREAENRKNGTPCEICGDYDCDDGAYCDDWDDREENRREEENRKNGIRCEICGDYDCDDGKYCDDRWDDDDDHHDRHGRHHDD